MVINLTGKSSDPFSAFRKPSSPTQGFSSRTQGFSADPRRERRSRGGRGRKVFQDIKAQEELVKIENTKKKITNLGGREKISNLQNRLGERIRTTTTYIDKLTNGLRINQRVFEVRNLDTGEVTLKRFDRNRQLGGVKYKEKKFLDIKPSGKAKSLKEQLKEAKKNLKGSKKKLTLEQLNNLRKASSITNLFVKQTADTQPFETKKGKVKLSKKKIIKLAVDVAIAVGFEVVGGAVLLYRGARAGQVIITGTTKNIRGIQVSSLKFKDMIKVGKTIGQAEVFSVGKGQNALSVTIGWFKRGGKIKQFVGIEGSQAVKSKLGRATFQRFIGKDGSINIIQVIEEMKNIKLLRGKGQGVVTIISDSRGIIFPTGVEKRVIKINVKQFGSVANSFTKGSWTSIFGKTVENDKSFSRFLAVIKRIDNPSALRKIKLNKKEMIQFSKQMQKTASVVSSALAKSKQVNPKNVVSVPIAIKIIQESIKVRGKGNLKTKIKTITPSKISPVSITKAQLGRIKTATTGLTKLQANSIIALPKSKLRTRQKVVIKQIEIQKKKIAQIEKQIPTQTNIQKNRTITRIKTSIINLSSQLKLIRTLIPIPPILRIPIIIPPVRFSPRTRRVSSPVQTIRGYNVYVKSRGKFKKVNSLPLTKSDALDRGAYVTDNSTAVTYKIVPLTRVKKRGKITKKEKGARNKIKSREFRIKKKRKITTPRRFIEKKGKPRINTRGEKRGLSASRVAKGLNKKRKSNAKKKRK